MPSTPPSADVWGLDAGGSRTTAVVIANGAETRKDFAPVSVGTVGSESAATTLSQVLDYVRSRMAPERMSYGCIGCSSMPVAMESPYPDVLVKVIESRAPPGTVMTANDMVPLLYAPPMNGVGIVVSSGTGSCVHGRNEGGRLAKVGGHEHIVSDEGSAYSLGRAALRAAAAAHDGTGPRTVLLDRVLDHYGLAIPALGRALAEQRSARASVAGFAPVVLDSADDPVAARIIGANAAALADAARVAMDRLALPTGGSLGFSGGVMRGSERYRHLVEQELAKLGRDVHTFVLDGTQAVLSMAQRLRDRGTPGRAPGGSPPFPGPGEALCMNISDRHER